MMDGHRAEGDQQAEMNVQAQPAGEDDSSSDSSARRDAERGARYRHCGMEEASNPEVWMSVNHGEGSEDEFPDRE